ncbi:MAG: hypothetical protein IH587_04480, partial [Anaerolineae bacterium]|nr:hypothetical protein [Anaerolineae bacterium]
MLHKHVRMIALCLLLLVLVSGALVSAQEPVEITITGTASGAGFDWLNTVVKPMCEAQLSDAGTPVTITPIEWVGSGDDFRQQVVLDL